MKLKLEKKTIIEAAVLASVALACLIYIGVRDRGEINYSLPQFPRVSADDITRIEISNPDGSVVEMGRTGDKWELGDGYPADDNTVDKILNTLEEFAAVDLVSESGKPERYNLDGGNRYSLKGYRGDDLVREVYLGKASSSGSYNYVLFPGSDKVYTIRGALVTTLDRPAENFRSKKVMSMNRQTIGVLELTTPEGKTILSQGTDGSWVRQDGEPWDEAKVQDVISRAANLQAVGFPKETLGDETARITLRGDREYSITLHDKTDQGYIAQTSDYPYPILITEYTGDALKNGFSETGE